MIRIVGFMPRQPYQGMKAIYAKLQISTYEFKPLELESIDKAFVNNATIRSMTYLGNYFSVEMLKEWDL